MGIILKNVAIVQCARIHIGIFVGHRGISIVEVHRWVGAALDRRDFCGTGAFSWGTVRKAICRIRIYILDVSDPSFMFQSYDVELSVPPSPEPDLPPWYHGFDKVGTKTSAKAQAITRVRRAMVSSGLPTGLQRANVG